MVSFRRFKITGNTICKSPIVGCDDADKSCVACAIGSSNVAIALKITELTYIYDDLDNIRIILTFISLQSSSVRYRSFNAELHATRISVISRIR